MLPSRSLVGTAPASFLGLPELEPSHGKVLGLGFIKWLGWLAGRLDQRVSSRGMKDRYPMEPCRWPLFCDQLRRTQFVCVSANHPDRGHIFSPDGSTKPRQRPPRPSRPAKPSGIIWCYRWDVRSWDHQWPAEAGCQISAFPASLRYRRGILRPNLPHMMRRYSTF